MKKIFFLFFVASQFILSNTYAQKLSPYIEVGDYAEHISQATKKVSENLEAKGFEVIGVYNPGGKPNLKVVVFTRNDLQKVSLKVADRGALASALKVGLKSNANGTTISYLNPDYLFNAYLRNEFPTHESQLKIISKDVSAALSSLGSLNRPFGGSLSVKDLREYQYKMMMPYFTDPVKLRSFASFEEGVDRISSNLAKEKGNTKMVYKMIFSSEKVAVFGVGLHDKEKGESHFLPIIGEDHLAAMPYEIILQDKQATMLHGRYRIALHWPDLTMGTFMKIMSTPGDIEDMLEDLCE
ncbi:hypothetical protein [Namhaeicola litoreus]|uniref:DUF302 domain-containing protein n=1 Tax=Namhaeicola litoreus TaxID=1052145 RepID=A0ABW3Y3D0_9FLAO